MRKLYLLIILIGLMFTASAQELYPVAENASNVPKGALGIRAFDEGYKETDLYRNLIGLRALYGITSRLSVYATATLSDIHEKDLPFDFITHNHSGGVLVSGTNTPQQGIPYPYIFNSIDLYAKYRFLSSDDQNQHFRMAGYLEGAKEFVPSHEAEPDLLMHTSGFGGGLIATYLKKHFAISATLGAIYPLDYSGDTYDKYGGVYPTTIQYGRAVNYSLSLGYLLFPRNYKSYKETNINIYCEFIGKAYSAAKAWQYDGPFAGAIQYTLPITTPILKGGAYLDAEPGLQFIFNSTYRVEVSVAFAMLSQSYDHLYPFYQLAVQRYFYFHQNRASQKSDKLQ